MIRKLVGTVVVLLIGAGVMYWLLGHHIVETADKKLIVPKSEMTLTDTYVDIRKWGADDFKEHAELTKDLISSGHQDVVVQSAGDKVLGAIKDAIGK